MQQNDIVEVTTEISVPDVTKSFDNYMRLMSEEDVLNEKKTCRNVKAA